MAHPHAPSPLPASAATRPRWEHMAIFAGILLLTAIVATVALTSGRTTTSTTRAAASPAAGGTAVADTTTIEPSTDADVPDLTTETAIVPADVTPDASAAANPTDTPTATDEATSGDDTIAAQEADLAKLAANDAQVSSLLGQLGSGNLDEADLARLEAQLDGVVSPAQRAELEASITKLLASPEGAKLQQQLAGITASAGAGGGTIDAELAAAMADAGL